MTKPQNVFAAHEINSGAGTHPALSQAIVTLLDAWPSFVAPILQSRLIVTNAGTAGVRHGELEINIDWFKKLKPDERQTLLCHEAAHVWLRHPERLGAFIEKQHGIYSPEEIIKWANTAMDCLINEMLLQCGFVRIDGWTTFTSTFRDRGVALVHKLKSMSWETLTIILMDIDRANQAANESAKANDPDAQPSQGDPQDGDQPSQGQGSPEPSQNAPQGKPAPSRGSSKTKTKPEDIRAGQDWGKVEPLTGEALAEAQQMPVEKTQTGIAYIDSLFNLEFPALVNTGAWRQRLRQFLTGRQDWQYTWSKAPRRRMAWPTPGKRRLGVGEIIVAIDISSSMPIESIETIFAETNNLSEEFLPERIIVIPFNTRALEPIELGCGEFLSKCPQPDGGTEFEVAFAKIAEYDDGQSPVLFLTDMDCRFPDVPNFSNRLMWVGIRSVCKTPPYGEYVDLDSE